MTSQRQDSAIYKRILKFTGKLLLWLTGTILFIFFLIWGILKTPIAQNYLIDKATHYVSHKTGTKVEIDKIDVGFPKYIIIEGLFLKDQNHDTLIAAQKIDIDIAMFGLLQHKISVDELFIENATINLHKDQSTQLYNLQFLLDTFASTKKDSPTTRDSTGTPWNISAEQITLTKCRFALEDNYGGLFLNASLEYVAIVIDDLNLPQKTVSAEEVALKGINIQLTQKQGSEPDTSNSTTSGWNIVSIEHLKIDNSSFYYLDKLSFTKVSATINHSELEQGQVNIEKQTVTLDKFSLLQSSGEVVIQKDTTTQPQANTVSSKPNTGWTVVADQLFLENNNFKFNTQAPKLKEGIDYNHLNISGIGTEAKGLFYQGNKILAEIHQLNLQESCGLGIKSFKGKFAMDEQFMSLKDFELNTNQSHIAQSAIVDYDKLDNIANSGRFSCNFTKCDIAVQELLWLLPDLEKTEIIARNKSRNLNLELKASGNLEEINIQKLILQTADTSYIYLDGRLRHVRNLEQMNMLLHVKDAHSSSSDLLAILPPSMVPTRLSIPQKLSINGNYNGTLSDFKADLNLATSDGNASGTVLFGSLKSKSPQYEMEIHTDQLALGKILKQEYLGPISSVIIVKGEGFDLKNAVADLSLNVKQINLNHYDYQNITADIHLMTGLANVNAHINDPNLEIKMSGSVGLDTTKGANQLDITVLGADLYKLGFSNKPLLLSTHITTDLHGNSPKNVNGSVSAKDLLMIKDNKEYRMDSLSVSMVNTLQESSFVLKSPIASIMYQGNIDLFSAFPILSAHVNKYFAFNDTPKAIPNYFSKHFEFNIEVQESQLMREAFLPAFDALGTLNCKGGFDGSASKFWMEGELPQASYQGNSIRGLKFGFDSNKDSLRYKTSITSLNTDQVKLFETNLYGSIANNKADINLSINDSNKTNKLQVNSVLSKSGKLFKYSILPDGLSIQQQAWEVSPNNFIEFGTKHIRFEKFLIHNNRQSITLQSSSDGETLTAQIHQFDLGTLSRIIEKKDSIVRGTIDGQISIEHLLEDLRFTSDLQVKALSYKNSKIGSVSIKADNFTAQRYSLQMSIADSNNLVNLSGYYKPIDKDQSLHFLLDIKSLQLSSFEAFSNDQISESSGALKGTLEITGNKDFPIFNGRIQFVEAKTKVAYINETLYMKDESIRFSPKGLSFDAFTVRDASNNTAKINGDILMKGYKDPKFDLNIITRNFRVLNTTPLQNKEYYGRLILDSDLTIKGTPELPKINATVAVGKGSTFTVVVSESKASVDRGDGIVVFLSDSIEQNAIMNRRVKLEEKASILKGFDLDAKIRILPHTPLKIIIDPYTGDSLVVKGKADLHFSMDPDRKMSLTGIYTLSSGAYIAYIEGIIPKSFELVSGSRIIWNGDPLDAQVDLKAKYNVKTSAAELMTLGSGTGNITDSSILARPLSFEVYLLVQGNLLEPQISFKLDMAENQRNTGGGSIYGKVIELNANEPELYKQVLSLLVLNKFIPATTVSSNSSISSFARSSVSRLMSDQLNQISGQYIKGVILNVDVQSYNFSQGGKSQSNTVVNVGVKKEFDRLSVQVGGNIPVEGSSSQQNNAQNLTGDVQIDYKLTKDGRYKLKAFRQNQVDNISNGVITETGTGILYSKDYNRTKDLFRFFKRKKKKK